MIRSMWEGLEKVMGVKDHEDRDKYNEDKSKDYEDDDDEHILDEDYEYIDDIDDNDSGEDDGDSIPEGGQLPLDTGLLQTRGQNCLHLQGESCTGSYEWYRW